MTTEMKSITLEPHWPGLLAYLREYAGEHLSSVQGIAITGGDDTAMYALAYDGVTHAGTVYRLEDGCWNRTSLGWLSDVLTNAYCYTVVSPDTGWKWDVIVRGEVVE